MSLFAHIIASEFSNDEGFGKVSEFVETAAEQAKKTGEQEPCLILAEKFSTASYIPFFKSCQKNGVKPIFGLKVTLQGESAQDHDLVLIAKNEQGRQNINRIVTQGHVVTSEKDYQKINREILEQHKDGLACVSGGENGLIEHFIINGEQNKAKSTAKYLKGLFGNDFYLQIKRANETAQKQAEEELIIERFKDIGKELDIKLFATNDVRFAKQENYKHHLTRKAILDGEQVYDPSREIKESANQYLLSTPQMLSLFEKESDAVFNVGDFVNSIDFSYFSNKLGTSHLPEFPIPEGFDNDPEKYLKHITEKGFEKIWEEVENSLKNRLGKISTDGVEIDEHYIEQQKQKYSERIDYELDVIYKTGFPGYFLIVQELVQWCKENDIPVGPGRGSGAGSLVLYSLGITDVDPIEFDLLFERFLNPERMSEPDIDIDFSPKNRDKVIEHMSELYGKENTAQIMTEGTMAAKSVIDNIGRVRGLLPYERDRIKSLINDAPGTKLKDELEFNEQLKEVYESSRQARKILDEALTLEGSLVSYGKHAGGVVISLGEMAQYAALYREKDIQTPVVQIDKDLCEDIGLIKFDLLGLNNLDIIKEAVKRVNHNKPEQEKANIDNISLDDEKSIELFQKADTYGVFQFESPQMRRLMKDLRPDNFEEVVALVALFRPGPLQSGMAEDFVKRKYDNSLISYPHPKLEEILKPTYGTIIYQEQVMSIARELAGFTLGQADILRKAMGKKIKEMMDEQRELFASGSAEQFRDSTLKTTGKKFKLNSTGKTKELDIFLNDIDVPFIQELIKETDGKIQRGEQIIEILKEYANLDEDSSKKLEANINYLEEKEFFNEYYPKLKNYGIEKLKKESNLNDEDAETAISRLTVASGIFIRFNKIFSLMDKFAAYGFNKSHSVAYAKISMQTAYLKSHHPAQYMSSLLSNQPNIEKVTEAINESRKMNLKIARPDINESNIDFEPFSQKSDEINVRYGLGQIKGLKKSVGHLIEKREQSGKIKDIYDFYNKFNGVKIKEDTEQLDGSIKTSNKTLITKTLFNNLINSGAFDSLCPDQDSSYRTHLYSTYRNFEEYNTELKKNINANYTEVSKKIKMMNNPIEDHVEELKGKDLKKFLSETAIENPEKAMEIYNKIEKAILDNSKNKTVKILPLKNFETFVKEKGNECEFFGNESEQKLYVKPTQNDYTQVPQAKTKERAFCEFSLTGAYQTAHPLYAGNDFKELQKEEFNVYKLKDLPKIIEAHGQGKKRKYFDLRMAGTIIDVSDFRRFNEESGEEEISLNMTIDDGTATASVRFKAHDLFQDGKHQKGIDMLNDMKNKEVIKIEGASTQGAYESAGVTIYANKIGALNPDFVLPAIDKDLSKNNAKKQNNSPSQGQIDFVKSLLKQNRVDQEDFLKNNSIEKLEDMSKDLVQQTINQYNKREKRNRP